MSTKAERRAKKQCSRDVRQEERYWRRRLGPFYRKKMAKMIKLLERRIENGKKRISSTFA